VRDAMPLSDRQIERYSRQIIVPGIGGLAQERLLASKVTLCGDIRDIEAPLAYLAGAGIGEITIATSDATHVNELIARISNQNPDVTIKSRTPSDALSLTRERAVRAQRAPGEGSPDAAIGGEQKYPLPGQGEGTKNRERGNQGSLLFAIIASDSSLEIARSICDSYAGDPTVVARLDDPARIAIFPAAPPCTACADAPLLEPFTSRADNADFVAMIAITEAFKLLAQYSDSNPASLVEFSGLATHSRTIVAARRCGCSILREQTDAR
jgi:hypothetical protein